MASEGFAARRDEVEMRRLSPAAARTLFDTIEG